MVFLLIPSWAAISSMVIDRMPYRINRSVAFSNILSLFSIFSIQNGYKTMETIFVTKVSTEIFLYFTDNRVKIGAGWRFLNSGPAECLIIFDNKSHT